MCTLKEKIGCFNHSVAVKLSRTSCKRYRERERERDRERQLERQRDREREREAALIILQP